MTVVEEGRGHAGWWYSSGCTTITGIIPRATRGLEDFGRSRITIGWYRILGGVP